jgi:putative transposase
MDFMSDQLFQGRRFRVLTLVDNFSRESVALRVAERFRGEDVVKVMEAISTQRGFPISIRVDNGPEFLSESLECLAYFKERSWTSAVRVRPRTMRLLSRSTGSSGWSA